MYYARLLHFHYTSVWHSPINEVAIIIAIYVAIDLTICTLWNSTNLVCIGKFVKVNVTSVQKQGWNDHASKWSYFVILLDKMNWYCDNVIAINILL